MMQTEHVILYRLYVEVKDAWTAEEWEAWENEKKEQRGRAEMAIIDIGMGSVEISASELRPSE